MQTDIYIEFLEFARGKGIEGFFYDELKTHLTSKGHRPQEDKLKALWISAQKDRCFQSVQTPGGSEQATFDASYILSFEGHSKLIDHYELQEARASSLQAQKSSNKAFLVAVLSAVLSAIVSIGVAFWVDVTIDEHQVHRIVQSHLRSNKPHNPDGNDVNFFLIYQEDSSHIDTKPIDLSNEQ